MLRALIGRGGGGSEWLGWRSMAKKTPKNKPVVKKKKKKRVDPFAEKSLFQSFLEDVQPGLRRPVRPKSTQAVISERGNELMPTRVSTEPLRKKFRERNVIFVARQARSAVPSCVFLENRDMFFFYDARADARDRVLLFPRREFGFHEDLVSPNLMAFSRALEKIGTAHELISTRQKYRDSSLAYHIKLGPWLTEKEYCVKFGIGGSRQEAKVPNMISWLIARKRMSVDSYRMMRNFFAKYSKYYRVGTRIDLLPEYQPIPPPEKQ